jgi:hypothetical protein
MRNFLDFKGLLMCNFELKYFAKYTIHRFKFIIIGSVYKKGNCHKKITLSY